jgi:two-component system, chemotaxis family, chemotaxis protein CheY
MSKAMVVDDSRTIRRILAATLGELGFTVCQAENGRVALETIERERASEPIQLVLVDWNMPEMNGLEFLRQLRAHPENAGTMVIMVTTETAVDQMVTALEAGANEYVMKPFTKDVIQDKLRLLGVLQ